MADAGMFTAKDAKRIASAVLFNERRPRKQRPVSYDGARPPSQPLKLSKTTATWAKNTTASLTEYTGTAGSETAVTGGATISAYNRLGDVASGKWVIIGLIDGDWYLVAVETTEAEVITGVTLGSTGLVFTKKTLLVYGVKSPDPSSTTITTTVCP